jgi:2'-5' RNA ligase
MEQLSMLLERNRDFQAGSMPVEEVVVVASELAPEGPTYSILGRAPLGG